MDLQRKIDPVSLPRQGRDIFKRSFRMTMDNLGWTGPRYDDYTTVAYYLLDEAKALPFTLPSGKELIMK